MENKIPGRHTGIIGSTDGWGYRLPNSGCKKATEFLNRQSICFECPFPTCKMDSNVGKSNAK